MWRGVWERIACADRIRVKEVRAIPCGLWRSLFCLAGSEMLTESFRYRYHRVSKLAHDICLRVPVS